MSSKMKALSLISSGIDSPVATKLMIKRGVDVIGVHFNNFPFTDHRPLMKTKKLCRILGLNKLYVVKHGPNQQEIAKNCSRKFSCVLCRRLMLKTAEEIAKREKADFLITGESIGQVASQTLDNLTVADNAVDIPILRPLLCFDKVQIVDLAKDFGTYDASIEPSYCCKLVPKFPATKSSVDELEREEIKLDMAKLINNAVETSEVVDIRKI